MSIDHRLREFATTRELEYIDAVEKHGSQNKASQALGVPRQAIQDAFRKLKMRAAKRGYAPEADMHRAAPEPFVVKGTSTYYDEEGRVRGQWVKTTLDHQKVEAAMRAAVEALAQDVKRAKPVPAPKATAAPLLNLYTITDYHVGMRAWKPETGADFDLDIAEATLAAAMEHLVTSSPAAKVGIVNQLGDFLHFDALAPLTPTAGHILDADGRYSHVVRVATRLLRRVIDTALSRHEVVYAVIAEGNHDIASSVWLRHLFACLYEKEPRLRVIESELPFYAHQHGEVMLAFHHGHLAKHEKLPGIFAARYAKLWGNTTKRYCHTGHMHHVEEKEFPGMKVVQHPTLAAADAYAARHGYLSEREITAITYHERWGQVGRNTVTPEMLAPAGT